jgi:transposase
MDAIKKHNSINIEPMDLNQGQIPDLKQPLASDLASTEQNYICFQQENRLLKEEIRSLKEELSHKTAQNDVMWSKFCTLKLENDDLRCLLSNNIPGSQRIEPLLSKSDYINLKEENEYLKKIKDDCLQRISELKSALDAAAKLNEELNMQLGKPRANTTNSGISSALDFTKSEKTGKDEKLTPEGSNKRSKGGQKGHKGHFRALFTKDEADEIYNYELEEGCCCPHCNSELVREPSLDKQKDIIELPPQNIIKQIHNTCAYKCPKCGKIHYGEPPIEVENSALLSAQILIYFVVLNCVYYMPLRKISDCVKRLFKINVSASYVNNEIKGIAMLLRPVYLELLVAIKTQKIINIDETVHKLCGKKIYNWIFAGYDYIAYKIGTRSKFILDSVLGPDYEGIIGCDCYICYISFAMDNTKVKLQICMSHLKRDFQRCADWLNNEEVRLFGENGKKYVDDIFKLRDLLKQAIVDDASYKIFEINCRLKNLQEKFIEFCINAPDSCPKARGIAKRFKEFPQFYFVFVDNPDVEITNNLAERLLRGPVVARKISYGTQSIIGNWCCEVFWTILETTKLKKIDFEAYLLEALTANLEGRPVTSLVNIGQPVDPKYTEEAEKELKNLKQELKDQANNKKAKEGVKPFDSNNKPTKNTSECNLAEPEPAKVEPEETKSEPTKAENEVVKSESVNAEQEEEKSKQEKAEPKNVKLKSEKTYPENDTPKPGKAEPEEDNPKSKKGKRTSTKLNNEPEKTKRKRKKRKSQKAKTKAESASKKRANKQRQTESIKEKPLDKVEEAHSTNELSTSKKVFKTNVEAFKSPPISGASRRRLQVPDSSKDGSGACPEGSHNFLRSLNDRNSKSYPVISPNSKSVRKPKVKAKAA